jgi:hypothetical protein
LSPFNVIVHIVDVAIVFRIIHAIRSSSFRGGATTTMVGYQPDAPPRPVAVPVPAEDAHVDQAIAAAPAIERPAVADVHQPSRQRQFRDVSSRRQSWYVPLMMLSLAPLTRMIRGTPPSTSNLEAWDD